MTAIDATGGGAPADPGKAVGKPRGSGFFSKILRALRIYRRKAATTEIAAEDAEPERFIPLSRLEINTRLALPELWPAEQATDTKRFFRYLSAWRHVTYNEFLDRLDSDYNYFSPDADIILTDDKSPEELAELRTDFLALIRRLLEQANFNEIPQNQLDNLLTRESEYGLDLHVDFADYDEVMVFWRGTGQKTRTLRRLKNLYLKKETVSFHIYKRLFLLLKLKDPERRIKEMIAKEGMTEKRARKELKQRRQMLPTDASSRYIYLKMFKDIPRSDMEMMFPNTRVKIRASDKVKLTLTAGSGLGGAIAGPLMKVIAATSLLALSPMTWAIAGLGLAGVASRQVGNIVAQRNRYRAILAQNLYFHSLADNRAAITLLTSRAEEEDIKEEMLLYSVLAKTNVRRDELPDVKAAIVGYLETEYGVKVDFDAEDALRRLMHDGVVTQSPDGMLRALTPRQGIEHLDQLWDGYLNPSASKDRSLLIEDVARRT